jgi:hypothetical protein
MAVGFADLATRGREAPVTIRLHDASARQALDALLRGRPFRYELPPEYAGAKGAAER